VAHCSPEQFSSSAADWRANGEDLGGFFEVRVQRGHGVDMPLYESEAAFATQPGRLAHGAPGVGEALTGFIAMKGKLDLEVTRVLEVGDLALVIGVWSFNGTGSDGEPVRLAARNADVLRRQRDGTWRFVIDNPWGTD
jgi:ketosteroid isomerase-like protein